ncbi:MAG: dipeptidase PepE [Calditrichaeota bacterium]|nr:MAG: dipeptidase PepE [Calditrichota bacterium]
MRLLLISNSTQHGSGYLDHCADEIRDFLGAARNVVFVPFALYDWDAYTTAARTRLQKLGFQVTGIHENEAVHENLRAADALFIGGGNTFRLLKRLYEHDLLEAIRERVRKGMPYMGASAGTNVACTSIKTTNDMPIVYPPSFDALALVPFNINPHYLDPDPHSTHQGETREQRIKEFHEENDNAVVGLREGALLRVEGQTMTLKGLSGARLFIKGAEPSEYAPGSDLSFLLA